MKLERIYLKQFRNYSEQEFACSGKGAIVIGPNGCGKTNLFEAIAYCSLGKSVRYQSDEYLVLFDRKSFSIVSIFMLNSGKCEIRVEYKSGKKKIFINDIQIKQLSQIYEYIKVIYCSPEDTFLINGSPRKRRMYFDMAIAQMYSVYIKHLRHYLHVLEQRNVLLKDSGNQKQKKHWDVLFIKAALPIIQYRLEYVTKLVGKIHTFYGSKIKEADFLDIKYKTSLNSLSDGKNETGYYEQLSRIESKEWQYQRSLIGPHLDDYDILMNQRLMKDIGSQGQKRTVTLLIKIAQLELLKDAIGEYPILLLDDIFAELDKEHTEIFMNILKNHEQVFIASPNDLTNLYWNDLTTIDLSKVL